MLFSAIIGEDSYHVKLNSIGFHEKTGVTQLYIPPWASLSKNVDFQTGVDSLMEELRSAIERDIATSSLKI